MSNLVIKDMNEFIALLKRAKVAKNTNNRISCPANYGGEKRKEKELRVPGGL